MQKTFGKIKSGRKSKALAKYISLFAKKASLSSHSNCYYPLYPFYPISAHPHILLFFKPLLHPIFTSYLNPNCEAPIFNHLYYSLNLSVLFIILERNKTIKKMKNQWSGYFRCWQSKMRELSFQRRDLEALPQKIHLCASEPPPLLVFSRVIDVGEETIDVAEKEVTFFALGKKLPLLSSKKKQLWWRTWWAAKMRRPWSRFGNETKEKEKKYFAD